MPAPSHRREPATYTPTPGMSTATSSTRAEDQQWADESPEPVVVEADRDHERHDADDAPQELAEEEVPGRPVVGERRDRRRREHHDHADEVEHRHRRRQQQRGRRRLGGGSRGGPSLRSVRRPSRSSWRHGRPDALRTRGLRRAPVRGAATVLMPDAPLRSRAARPRGRSRRRGPRSSRTSRAKRSPVTTTPCRRPARVDAAVRTARCMDVARSTGTRPSKTAATVSVASPMATTARSRGANFRSRPRSRDRSRPPAISTTCSKPSSALAAACPFVAFESSTYCTPWTSPTNCTRCGSPVQPASVRATADTSAPARNDAAAAASPLSTSWAAPETGTGASTPCGPTSMPSATPYPPGPGRPRVYGTTSARADRARSHATASS